MSSFYIVSTPIGNLEDITFRAVGVLKAVSRILAEDTRRTSILLRRYGIETPLVSAHEHNEAARVARLISWLDEGADVALVSDAGTPLLSDPGARLVQAVIAAAHAVVPVPGASALLAALVGAGLPAEPFTFYGFLPRTGRARAERLAELAALRHSAVLYESPVRLKQLLTDLLEVCEPERSVAVARELTKVHESFVRGTLTELTSYYDNEQVRGEVVLVLGAAPPPASATAADARALANELLASGLSARTAAKQLAEQLNMPRNDAYSLVLAVTGAIGREKE
jgi:16S rRNA (cytidine1402-2'-O)-methyltransferase